MSAAGYVRGASLFLQNELERSGQWPRTGIRYAANRGTWRRWVSPDLMDVACRMPPLRTFVISADHRVKRWSTGSTRYKKQALDTSLAMGDSSWT